MTQAGLYPVCARPERPRSLSPFVRPPPRGYIRFMNTDNGRTRSVWMATADTGIQPELRTMSRPTSASSAAASRGSRPPTSSPAKQVRRPARRRTARRRRVVAHSAHFVYYNDDGLTRIEQLHGTEGLQIATDSHKAAVDRIFEIAAAEKIECDLKRVDGYLFVSPRGQQHDFLEKELDAAHRIGYTQVKWVDRAPLPFETGRRLSYPHLGQFHPLKYLEGLLKAIWKCGGRVYGHTHAENITSDGTTACITTRNRATITAGSVVVATNSPVNDRFAIHTKQSPWRTYVVGFGVPTGSVPHGLYWDTEDPYHYVRLQTVGDHDVLIVGGEDHKTGHANDPDRRYGNLERWTRSASRWQGRSNSIGRVR